MERIINNRFRVWRNLQVNAKSSNSQASPITSGSVSNSDFNCMFAAIIAILKKVTSIDEKFSKIQNDLEDVKDKLGEVNNDLVSVK